MARNWTLAALDEISYNTHSTRLTLSTILQIVWLLFRYVQVLNGMLNVSLEMVARENRKSSLLSKVTNKPSICRALLLKNGC